MTETCGRLPPRFGTAGWAGTSASGTGESPSSMSRSTAAAPLVLLFDSGIGDRPIPPRVDRLEFLGDALQRPRVIGVRGADLADGPDVACLQEVLQLVQPGVGQHLANLDEQTADRKQLWAWHLDPRSEPADLRRPSTMEVDRRADSV